MMGYIPLMDYAAHLNIKDGESVFVSSDTTTMMMDAVENDGSMDLNQFIDGLIQAVGKEGTIIFPTYTWRFCKGETFNYSKTSCKTGALGRLALKRKDFRRTRHPIYSFAVYGKWQQELVDMQNRDSFGKDSPFAFFHKKNVVNYIIDVPLKSSFTFNHYVEEASCTVSYRYIKNFTAEYVTESGERDIRTYSMFVRDLDKDVVPVDDDLMEQDFIEQHVETKFKINNSIIKRIELGKAFPIILNDIVNNNSKKICNFKGQK